MKINENNSVIGIWKYSRVATYEKGDFVVSGENIYIVRADTVTGVDPLEDTSGKYEIYPGNLITTKEEYDSIIQNPDLAKDKYVSSSALEQILKSTYFGLDSDGVINSSIDVASSGNIRLRGLNGISSVDPLDSLLVAKDFNNGAVRVSREIPEVSSLIGDYSTKNQGDSDYWIQCDRSKCIGCGKCVKCGQGNILKVNSGKTIADLLGEGSTDTTEVKIVIDDSNNTRREWYKPVNICPVGALSYVSSGNSSEIVLERTLWTKANQQGTTPAKPKRNLIVFDSGFETYTTTISGSETTTVTTIGNTVGLYGTGVSQHSPDASTIISGVRNFIADAKKGLVSEVNDYFTAIQAISISQAQLTAGTAVISQESTTSGTTTRVISTTSLQNSSTGTSALSINLFNSDIQSIEHEILGVYSSSGSIFPTDADVNYSYGSYLLLFILMDLRSWENWRYGGSGTGDYWTWRDSSLRMDYSYIDWDNVLGSLGSSQDYWTYEIITTQEVTTSGSSSTTSGTRSSARTLAGAVASLHSIYSQFSDLSSSIPFKRSDFTTIDTDIFGDQTASEDYGTFSRLLSINSWKTIGVSMPVGRGGSIIAYNIWINIGNAWERSVSDGKYTNAITNGFFLNEPGSAEKSEYKLTHSVDCVMIPEEIISCFTKYDTLTQEEKNTFISSLNISPLFPIGRGELDSSTSILYDTIISTCGSISGVSSIEKLATVLNAVAKQTTSGDSGRVYCSCVFDIKCSEVIPAGDFSYVSAYSTSLPYLSPLPSTKYDYSDGKSNVVSRLSSGISVGNIISPAVTYSEWSNMLDKTEMSSGTKLSLSPKAPSAQYDSAISYDRIIWPTSTSIDSSVTNLDGYYEQNNTESDSSEYLILKQYTYKNSDNNKVRVQELIDPVTAQRFMRSGIGENKGAWKYSSVWNDKNYLMKKISRITDYATTLHDTGTGSKTYLVNKYNNKYSIGQFSSITIIAINAEGRSYSTNIDKSGGAAFPTTDYLVGDDLKITLTSNDNINYGIETTSIIPIINLYVYGRES